MPSLNHPHSNYENVLTICCIYYITLSSALPIDLSHRWSALIYGFAATFGATSGIISPSISGYILTDSPVSICCI